MEEEIPKKKNDKEKPVVEEKPKKKENVAKKEPSKADALEEDMKKIKQVVDERPKEMKQEDIDKYIKVTGNDSEFLSVSEPFYDDKRKKRRKAGKYNRFDPRVMVKTPIKEENEVPNVDGVNKVKPKKLKHKHMFKSDSDGDDAEMEERRKVKKFEFNYDGEWENDKAKKNRPEKGEASKNKKKGLFDSSDDESSHSSQYKRGKFLDESDGDDYNDKFSMPLTKEQIFKRKLRSAQQNIPVAKLNPEDLRFLDSDSDDSNKKKGKKENASSSYSKRSSEKKVSKFLKYSSDSEEEESSSEENEGKKGKIEKKENIVQPKSPFLNGDETSRYEEPFTDDKNKRTIPYKKLVKVDEEEKIDINIFLRLSGAPTKQSPEKQDPVYERVMNGRRVDESEYYRFLNESSTSSDVKERELNFEESRDSQQTEDDKKQENINEGKEEDEEKEEEDIEQADKKSNTPKKGIKFAGDNELQINDIVIASSESSSAIRRKKNKFLAMEDDYSSDETSNSLASRGIKTRKCNLKPKSNCYLDNDGDYKHGKRFIPNFDDDLELNPRLYKKRKTVRRISDE